MESDVWMWGSRLRYFKVIEENNPLIRRTVYGIKQRIEHDIFATKTLPVGQCRELKRQIKRPPFERGMI